MIMTNRIIDKAPLSGYIIAYTDEHVVYSSYKIVDNEIAIDSIYDNVIDNSYEFHFFDDNMEYRLIRREARNDIVELLVTSDEEKDMDEDLIFVEDVLVSPQYLTDNTLPDKIRIVNRYKYSDNDTLVLDNYRIASTCKK